MSLIIERNQVLDIYSEARDRKWVIPSFNAENLTTIEAILDAVYSFGKKKNIKNLPIIIGITNNYSSRSQSVFYTHTKKWNIGIKLFLKNLEVLASQDSPYKHLRVMVHLDHIQWDEDDELLKWDMEQFSSIMYDASTLPLEKNIRYTTRFVESHKSKILIEGACDEISSLSNHHLTTPDEAEKFFSKTGVDIIVPNLGTEHRSSTSTLKYEGELAREISCKVGPRLCLHGASSLAEEQVSHFFNDGICKVNIWTILERDSAPVLLSKMIENAAKIIGPEKAKKLLEKGLLGENADIIGSPSIDFYATSFRREVIYNQMRNIVRNYLRLLYV